MVFVLKRRLLDAWLRRPRDDPRLDGLLDLSGAICDIVDMSWGEEVPDQDLLPSPYELAAMMRDLADRIESYTDLSIPPDQTR